MAHSRINRDRMFDWIERCLAADKPTPSDADICDHFGFDSTETARTLLADLADAGRITIRGHRDDRTITLGRVKSAIAPVARAEPAVRKADAVVDHTVSRITDIVLRGRKPAAAVAAENAGRLLKNVTTKPAQKKPAETTRKEVTMPAKTVQLPASAVVAISAVEERAKQLGASLGVAAADLIVAGSQTIDAENASSAPLSVGVLLLMLGERFAERPDQSEELAAEQAARAAAEARADAAEAKLNQLRALVA